MPRSVAMWPWACVSVRALLSASALVLATAAGPVGAQVGVGPSGSPGYNQAIKLPPGIAGMTPNLGLSFGGGGVNGPLGYGWSLQGLSMITRCAGITASDGAPKAVLYKPSDKLCLDGQRLIQTDAAGRPVASTPAANGALNDAQGLSEPSFTEYRTEKDSYARIRAYGAAGGDVNNGPAYFRVWTKSGQVYDYGATPSGNTRGNALVRAKSAAGTDTVAVAWATNRISDTLGNYIDFFYAQRDVAWGTGPVAGTPRSGHEWGLVEVQYTGTSTKAPQNKLVFEYEDRPDYTGNSVYLGGQDRSEAYHQGSKNVSIWRLKAVRSYINWDGSVLGVSGSGTPVAPPASAVKVNTVKLGYSQSPGSSRSLLTTVTECAGRNENLCQQPTQFSYSSPANSEAYTPAASSTGFETLVMRDLEGKRGVINADFYGDGRQSLIRWSDTPSENQLWRSNGDGTFSRESAFNITGENLYKSDSCYYTQVMDMNGDGLPDLLRYSNPKSLDNKPCATSGPVLVFINNGNGTFTSKPWAGPALERISSYPIRECPGDPIGMQTASAGLRKLALTGSSTSGSTSNQSTCGPMPVVGYTAGANFFLFDVDGDGLADVLTTVRQEFRLGESEPCPTTGCTRYWHANPNGTFDERPTNLRDVAIYVSPSLSSDFGQPKKLVDVDGDGLVDIVGLNTTKFGTAAAYRNSGDGTFTPIASPTSCDLPGDFNGDGRGDCLAKATDALPWNNSLSIAVGGGAFEKTANFNLTGIGSELGAAPETLPVPYGALIADFNGDGRSDVLRWAADPSKHALFLSKGDGTFRTSTTFNFNGITLKDTTEGKVDFLLGDFTGHGNVEILRMVANPYVPSGGGGDPCTVQPLSRSTANASLVLQPIPCDMAVSTQPGGSVEPSDVVSGASFNQLFIRQDQRPADLLLTVTSPTGLRSRLTYTSVSNPLKGLDADGQVIDLPGPRYVSARVPGQSSYPKVDVAFPMNIVADLTTDTGIGGGALTTSYAYRGLRVAVNGRGMLGFMQVSQQSTAADGSPLTVQTQYFQDHPYIGVAAVSQTFKGPLGVSSARLSRSTNGYCEASGNPASVQDFAGGAAPTPCLTSALVQRPYLAQSLEEGWDLSGDVLPTVKKTSTYNSDGDPLTISIQTTGTSAGQTQTFTKLVSNTYDPADTTCGSDNKTCNWTLGRLKRATATNTVPNLLPSLTASAGSNANATAISGTLTLPSSPTAELTASLSFSNVPLSTLYTQKATLTNNGTAALTVSTINAGSVSGTGFSFQSTDCTASLGAKSSCSVTVGFQPTVAGPASGTLTINTALGARTSSLSGSTAGASTLTLSPSSVALADTLVNQTRDSSTITLTNGAVAVSGLTFTPPTGYVLASSTCGTSLAASGSCTFVLRFQPTAAQVYNGNLSVTASGGASATLAVTGKGVAAASSISASPTSLTLADTVINQTSNSSTVTLTNGAVAISGLTITPPTGYTLLNSTCSATLAASGSCSFALAFKPTAVQSYNGSVSITASGGVSTTVAVTGKGINGTGAVVLDHVSPASSGTVIPAYSTTTIAVYYKNNGSGAAVLNNVSTTSGSPYYNNDGSGGSCAKGLSLAPGAKCWLLQGWGGGPGTVSATLSATFDSTTINTPLSAVQKTLDVSASNVGGSTATTLDQVLTITNNTPGAFQFGSPRIRFGTVSGSGSWAVVADTCPAVLTPGNYCTITARYTAGTAGNGSVTASVYGQFEWADLLDGYPQRSGNYRGIADVQSTSLSATSLSPVVLDHVSPAASGWVIPAYSTTTLGLYYYNRSNTAVMLNSIATTSGTNFWDANSSGSGGSCVPGRVLAAGAKCWILQGWGGGAGTVSTSVTAVFGSTTIVTPVSAVQKTLGLSATNVGGSTQTTLDQVITIDNQTPGAFQFGSPRIRFGSVSGSGSWAVVSDACPAVLNPGNSCTITARYTAGAAGSGSVSASVYGQFEWADLLDGNSQRSGYYRGITDVQATTLSATSLPPPASLSVSPASISFADTATNQVRDSATVTLTNGATSVSGLSLTPSSGFSIINSTCGSSLSASASCSFAVRFAPTAVQNYSGSVSISANGGAATASVSLSGKGLGVPKFEATTASPFSAGTTLTPYAASGGHVNFKNTGTANVTISGAPTMTNGGVAYTTNGDSSWCGAGVVVAPGASCGVYVYWSSAPGDYSGTLTVPSNGGSPSVVVNARYQGALSFSAVDFGNVTVNTTADRVVTVTNTAAFTARSINVYALSAPFSVVGNSCGSTIAPGGTCQVTVRFAPTATTGASATLRIDGMYNQVYNQTYEAAQAGNVMPYTAGLAGTGVPASSPLAVSLYPTYLYRSSAGVTQSTGSVTATPTGGVGPYSYLWSVQTVQSGTGKVYSGATSATATLAVTPPALCDIGVVDFLLTVTDSVGAKANASITMSAESTGNIKISCLKTPSPEVSRQTDPPPADAAATQMKEAGK